MKQVVATALVLLLTLFLCRCSCWGGAACRAVPAPAATGTCPSTAPWSPPARRRTAGYRVRVPWGTGGAHPCRWTSTCGGWWRRMPASFEPEALKAQTVAARTYTLSKMERTVRPTRTPTCAGHQLLPGLSTGGRRRHWGRTPRPTPTRSPPPWRIPTAWRPSSTTSPSRRCSSPPPPEGRWTRWEVWGNAVPYLTSVDSPEGDEVPNYPPPSRCPWTSSKGKLLAQYPQADLSGEPAGWFANLVPNSAGGVETVDIGGVTVGGGSLRTLFGLRSTSFTVSRLGGWGHLLRHRLRPRRGHEPVRRQRPWPRGRPTTRF